MRVCQGWTGGKKGVEERRSNGESRIVWRMEEKKKCRETGLSRMASRVSTSVLQVVVGW
jgi:hypothetical protein